MEYAHADANVVSERTVQEVQEWGIFTRRVWDIQLTLQQWELKQAQSASDVDR